MDKKTKTAPARKKPASKSRPKATAKTGSSGPHGGEDPLFEYSIQGVAKTDAEGYIVAVNPAFANRTGFLPEKLDGKELSFLVSDPRDRGLWRTILARLKEEGKWEGRVFVKSAEGGAQQCRMTGFSGKVSGKNGFICLFSESSGSGEGEASGSVASWFDPLTRLPNRRSFGERLSVILDNCRRNESFCAILIVDINKFHAINEMLGFSNGDQLLQSLSNRLKSCIREVDAVFRLGNDEFVLVLEAFSHPEDISLVAKRVLTTCAPPFRLSNREIYITVSIGISICPSDGTTEDQLLKSAHAALNRAKEYGVNHIQHYHPTMNAKIMEEFMLDNDLRKALEQQELLLHYQPQVDLTTGEVYGCEALIRWMHPQRGMVSPGQFVHLAESNGLIIPMGEWVLKTACLQARAWQEQYSRKISMAVNLSNQQFQQLDLTDRIGDILRETGCDPESLELEITETVGMKNPKSTLKALKRVKSMGVRIAIDDFGTGYSSIYYLKKFPIDSIKIDRSFVDDMAADPNAATIVLAMIAMARSLNLSVIAEGVETREQLDYLFGAGCRKIQGFFFSQPVPAAAFELLLQDPGIIRAHLPHNNAAGARSVVSAVL